jgi:EpsI family protein
MTEMASRVLSRRWVPFGVLLVGTFLILGAGRQESHPLQGPLGGAVPMELAGYEGQDDWISDAEAEVAGFSNYLFRQYFAPSTQPVDSLGTAQQETNESPIPWFTLYVGFYETQAEGKTIHSPKNCLPGAGWEALSSEPVEVRLGDRTETVNQYLIQNGDQRSLALYWYQGRGRVAHNEYRVKWNLLVDAALRHRSDEALVRIIVPVMDGREEEATELAVSVAQRVLPNLERALPQ